MLLLFALIAAQLRERSHCCCRRRQSRSSLVRSQRRTQRNVTVNRNEASASVCVRVSLTHSFSAADANCAASVDGQLDFFQSWLGNRNRNNWNSSRRKFACVASISNSQSANSPPHTTPPTTPHHTHFTFTSAHALLLLPLETWCQVRDSLSRTAQIHSQSRCRSLSRCLSWRRRQLRSTLHSASGSARAVINFYGFSPLDEAEADSYHSAACTGTARVNEQ